MEHVTIGGVDVQDEYGMRLQLGFEVQPPAARTIYKDIPGRDGLLDLTETLTGRPCYEQRTVVLPFSVYGDTVDEIERKKIDISRAFNGKRMDYTIPSIPEYTLNGRISVEFGEVSPVKSNVTLTIVGDPWMRKARVTESFSAYPSVTKEFMSGGKPQRVSVTTAQDVYVTYKGVTDVFPKGTHTSSNLAFTPGKNIVTFRADDGWVHFVGDTLVVSDGNIALGGGVATLSGGKDSVSSSTLVLDDAISRVTVSYDWEDL